MDTLAQWLDWLQANHRSAINLGLDRVQQVANELSLVSLNATVVTVAGTNGKGSFVQLLSSLLTQSGKRVGCYTSPHVMRFNERISIDGQEIEDGLLIEAFAVIKQAQATIELSFFEFTTLAALWLFSQKVLDVVVLEVGLGGRLDAVNVLAPDVAVITSIGLDHQAFLGDTLEEIAYEKCGILRDHCVFISAIEDSNTVIEQALDSHESYAIHRDFTYHSDGKFWRYSQQNVCYERLPENGLSVSSMAAALFVANRILPTPLVLPDVQDVCANTHLLGRFQHLPLANEVNLLLDVAHNDQAMSLLYRRLLARPLPKGNKRVAVFACLNDKTVDHGLRLLSSVISLWFVAELKDSRATVAQLLVERLHGNGIFAVSCSKNTAQALARAVSVCVPGDDIIVFGSFAIVYEVLHKKRLA